MINTQLKANIDSQITNETTDNSITPTEVGGNLKDIVDYIDQEVLSVRPNFLTYRAIITKTGTGSSAIFTLNESENSLGKTLVATNSGSNCVISEDTSEDFMTSKTFIKVTDMSYLNAVQVKFSKDSNNQISIFSYFNGSDNINFTDNIQIEILVYPV